MTDQDLLDRLPPERRAPNGVPSPDVAGARERAARLASLALAGALHPDGVRTSPLGPGWSRDLDLHVRRDPDPEALRALGWLPLDGLLGRLGAPGGGRWAVVEDGAALAVADLHRSPPPDAVAAVLARARRRREVRAREVLELRALLRAGRSLPDDQVVRVAARVEAGLGGDELARWRRGRPAASPAPLPGLRSLLRRPRRRRRLAVAVSGVDGAGKSELCRVLAEDLHRLGVPVSVVWTRPGMRLGILDRLARTGKRALGHGGETGLRRVAGGEDPRRVRSRRGMTGWTWAFLVTAAFVRDVRRQWRRARGVVLFDRHLVDALVTLDVAYGGVGLGLHRAMVRRLVPDAALTIYLDVPAEIAARRKPEDLFAPAVLRRQLEAYERRLEEAPAARRLDATTPPGEVAALALRAVLGA
jgi:thymidylate kinase